MNVTGYAGSVSASDAGTGLSPYVMLVRLKVVEAVNDEPFKPMESSTITPDTSAVPVQFVAVPLDTDAVVGGEAPL